MDSYTKAHLDTQKLLEKAVSQALQEGNMELYRRLQSELLNFKLQTTILGGINNDKQ